jgi:hypothetical protein
MLQAVPLLETVLYYLKKNKNITVVWHVTPRSVLEEYYQRYGGTCCLRRQVQTTLKMEAEV